MTVREFGAVVIGAGVAGAGVAAALSTALDTLVVEQESQPGYHSSGRSAALFFESYGNAPVRALSRASRSFFFAPLDGFAPVPLLRPRGSIIIATESQRDLLDELARADISPGYFIDGKTVAKRFPLLRRDAVIGGLAEDDSSDIEVHELLQGYLRQLKAAGGKLVTSSQVQSLRRSGSMWRLTLAEGAFEAPIVINAAGAWADLVGGMAGLSPLGLIPKRRTAALVPPPPGLDIGQLPLVMDIAEQFYVKPDSGQLLISPADETPSDPCDVQPEELDVAIAVDRVQTVMSLDVRRVAHRWAGLRTFAPDRTPVVGFDPRAAGFFWLAGQGGYGIQTAPAISELAAALILQKDVPQRLADYGVDARDLAPDRLICA